jgi:diguanylate cyclase (GGDEF)-like protein
VGLSSHAVLLTLVVGIISFVGLAVTYSLTKYEMLMKAPETLPGPVRLLLVLGHRLQIGSQTADFFLMLLRTHPLGPSVPDDESITRFLRAELRTGDDLIPLPEHQWALVVNAPVRHAATVGNRLATRLREAMGVSCALATAHLPEDGLNGGALVESARNKLSALAPGVHAIPPPESAPPEPPITEAAARMLDPETGVLHPKYGMPMARKFIDRARRRGREFSLILFEMDRFGEARKSYGDEVARGLARATALVLEQHLREEDLIGRISPSTFFALSECAAARAALAAGRVLKRVHEISVRIGFTEVHTSILAGVTDHTMHTTSVVGLFDQAHAALHGARDRGQTACAVYDPEKHPIRRGRTSRHRPGHSTDNRDVF